jgi:hypothetical protein
MSDVHPEFADRREAGRRLAVALEHLAASHPLVLALPRGGVPVAAEVARALGADLDLLIVRKLGAPGMRSLASAPSSMGRRRISSSTKISCGNSVPARPMYGRSCSGSSRKSSVGVEPISAMPGPFRQQAGPSS